jgi:hypothetical protein
VRFRQQAFFDSALIVSLTTRALPNEVTTVRTFKLPAKSEWVFLLPRLLRLRLGYRQAIVSPPFEKK